MLARKHLALDRSAGIFVRIEVRIERSGEARQPPPQEQFRSAVIRAQDRAEEVGAP